jgi:hypothetical protein
MDPFPARGREAEGEDVMSPEDVARGILSAMTGDRQEAALEAAALLRTRREKLLPALNG